jgi:hypothetical protein
LHFSLQAASPETFGYSFVCIIYAEKSGYKVKVKVVAIKAYWGSGGIASLIL